jgi:hypothetical protein
MSFLKKLFGKKQNSTIFSDEELINANACPNCWGRELYDDKFTQYVKDNTKDNINHDKQHLKAFVSQFVETYVTGIQLKHGDNHLTCPKCQKMW